MRTSWKIGEYVIITKEMKRNKNIWQDCENIFYEQRKILIQKKKMLNKENGKFF